MTGSYKYSREQRISAVREYRTLLDDGFSQRQARAQAGLRWSVNPSSLHTWVDRGVDWTPGGQPSPTILQGRCRDQVSRLEQRLANVERKQAIIVEAVKHFECAGNYPDLDLVDKFVDMVV